MMTFGDKFRRARRMADLTLAQVSKALGVSVQFVHQIERKGSSFPVERVASLPPEMRDPVMEALIEEAEGKAAELRQRRDAIAG